MASRLERVVTAKQVERFVVAPYGDSRPAHYRCADATANEVEINAAIVAANALPNGGVVELLDGTFAISDQINPLNNVTVHGQGMFMTKIEVYGTNDFNMVDFGTSTANDPLLRFNMFDLELDGSNFPVNSGNKGIHGTCFTDCRFQRLYVHHTTATGMGIDFPSRSIVADNLVTYCGYQDKLAVTAASWSGGVFTYTSASANGFSVGSLVTITGILPSAYQGTYNVTSIVSPTTFTVDSSNNSQGLNFTTDPGTVTTLGFTSRSLIGHNGIGIGVNDNYDESFICTNNICVGNQNNNYLVEDNGYLISNNASFIFSNNISVSAGKAGYRNTGALNTQFNNNYDFQSPIGTYITSVVKTANITSASWLAGVATFTTNIAHEYEVGTKVVVTSMLPSGYNGYYSVASVPDSTTFTISIASDPGVATNFGQSKYVFRSVDGTSVIDSVFSDNLTHGLFISTRSDGLMIKNNTIKYCYNYGINSSSGYIQYSGNRIFGCGRQGIIHNATSVADTAFIDISNNDIYDNGNRIAADGILINAATGTLCSDLTIQGNRCFDNQDTKTQLYGLDLSGPVLNCSVVNNDLSGNLTGSLRLQSTNNTIYISNNIGVNPTGSHNLGSVSGSVTFDVSVASYFKATLTGNISPVMPTSIVDGALMTMVLQQDGTGSRTVTLPANTVISGGPLTLSTSASAIDTIVWAYKAGTGKWVEVSRAISGGVLPISQLNDANGNPYLKVVATTSAIGGLKITNNVSGGTVTLQNDNTGNSATLIKGAGSGVIAFRPTTNSTNALGAQDAAGANILRVDSTNSRVGVGASTPAPASVLHAYQNTTDTGNGAGVTIEQAGSGDAVLQFLLTGAQRFMVGLDNSDSDKFKMGFQSALGSTDALVIDTSGNISFNKAAVAAGTSTTAARVGGVIFDHYTDTTVGGAETDIYTDTLASNIFGANGDKIIASYAGNFVTVGTELTQLKLYFAGTAIWDSTGVAPTTGTTSWKVSAELIRVSSTVVRYTVSLNTTGASGYIYAISGELTGLTLSGTNILKVTGTSSGVGSGAGDIIGKMSYGEWKPAA